MHPAKVMPDSASWLKLTFQARGPSFSPRAMSLPFASVFHAGEVATFGGSAGQVVQFGSALYEVPPDLPQPNRIGQFAAACIHLAELLPAFRAAGASEFTLHFLRRFSERCAWEFTREEIRLLASLDCHLFFVGQRVGNGEASQETPSK